MKLPWFAAIQPQQRLSAAALWHVVPPSVRRAAASAERLTAARSVRCWSTALAGTGRSAWLPAVALLARQLARFQVAFPLSGVVPSSLGLRLTLQSRGRAPAGRGTPLISTLGIAGIECVRLPAVEEI